MIYLKNDRPDDWHLRWGGVIVRVMDGKEPFLFYINNIEKFTKTNVTMVGSSFNGSKWSAGSVSIDPEKVDTTFPQLGYFNSGNIAQFLMKTPRNRVYRKGFCNVRAQITPACANDLHMIGVSWSDDLLDHIEPIYNRKYCTVKEALSKIYSKEMYSCAISPTLCIAASISSKLPVLVRSNSIIGTITKEGVAQIKYKHKYFSEELAENGIEVTLLKEASNAD